MRHLAFQCKFYSLFENFANKTVAPTVKKASTSEREMEKLKNLILCMEEFVFTLNIKILNVKLISR